ncbi:type III secretion system protein PrgE [Lactococcus lactis]|uniref:type III secretion system protein PrgE n=1 Tax=Lactococcus lactis TaxID=1358 RepID=UPI0018C806CA|nr:type III secretion system protein PrgE [Lactococcus lactis]MBG1279304.1 type III secretion system protein PrgE [Lactococcus lactis subsp. lactis]
MVKFQEKTGQRSTEYIDFSEGPHEAKIARAQLTKTKDETRNMIKLRIVGEDGESGFYNITFGDELGEEQLLFLLTSIKHNGQDIPEDVDWDYNRETVDFLKGKDIYIEVKNRVYQGETRAHISRILNQDEYDSFFEE